MLLNLIIWTLLIRGIFSGSKSDLCESTICTTITVKRCNNCGLDCNYLQLSHIPENLPQQAGCLFANNNNMTDLSATDLALLPNLVEIDVSFNKITSIKDEAFLKVGKKLITLMLHQNKLNVIRKRTFAGLVHLKYLHLDHNRITKISAGAFDDLVSITNLQISDNRLSMSDNQSVPTESFAKLTNLQNLEVQGNNVTGLTSYRADLLQNLTNLTDLRLDGVQNGEALPEVFGQLLSLQTLRIYGKAFNVINNNTFVNLGGLPLQDVQIIDTYLEMIETMAFSHTAHLQRLSIINSHLGLCNMMDVWPGLQNTNLKNLTLSRVVNPYGNYIFLPCNFFERLGNQAQQIEKLNLEGNNIIYVDEQISSNLSNLKELSIEFNRLQSIHTFRCSSDPEELAYTPRNVITCYKYCDNNTEDTVYGESLRATAEWATGILHLPTSIKILHISASFRYESQTVPKMTVNGCSNLNYVRLRASNVMRFKGPIEIVGNSSKEGLGFDLRGNYASYLSDKFFGNADVRYIDLGDNALGHQLFRDVKGKTFDTYTNLTTLDLGNNAIRELPKMTFIGLENLRVLNLSENSLIHFLVELSHMKDLQIVDLSMNLFITLDVDAMQLFDQTSLSIGRSLDIDLRWNQFVCACETLKFIEWALRDSTTLKYHNRSYLCFYKSKPITFGVYQDAHRTDLMNECSSKSALMVGLALFLATLVTLSIAVVAYRHRWDIKFFIVRCYRRRQWNEFIAAEKNRQYEFNAFVAYHDNDINWVRDELLNNLENTTTVGTNGETNQVFKLCVHDRDFIPGIDIEDNILEGIRSSNKCIVILTRSFLSSGWCEFELQMARLDCFDHKKNNIIVVMLEPLPHDLLTPSLAALIRRTTILEWPYAPRNQPLFWEKMRQALTSKELTPLLCECGRSVRQRWSTRKDSAEQVGQFRDTMTLN